MPKDVSANQIARFAARLRKAGVDAPPDLATRLAPAMSAVSDGVSARSCADSIVAALPPPPRKDVALEALAAFRGYRNWAHMQGTMAKSATKPQETALPQASVPYVPLRGQVAVVEQADVLHRLVRTDNPSPGVAFSYRHPSSTWPDDRRVEFRDAGQTPFVGVFVGSAQRPISLVQKFLSGLESERTAEAAWQANWLADEWLVAPSRHAGWEVMARLGFDRVPLGGGTIGWEGRKGQVTMTVTEASGSGLDVPLEGELMVTVQDGDSEQAYLDAVTSMDTLKGVIERWGALRAAAQAHDANDAQASKKP